MDALLIGAGRMGLTHLALLNLLSDFSLSWTVVEPSHLMRMGLRRALRPEILRTCVATLDCLEGDYDLAVICSPTPHHQACHDFAARHARRIFVEKPLAVLDPGENTLCGYVLLHHPLHRRFAKSIAGKPIEAIEISLRANTVLGPNPGWRGYSAGGGGVINEFGSHLFSLLVDLAGPVEKCDVVECSSPYSPAAPDRATITGQTRSGVPYVARLDWSDPTVRKPLYQVTVQQRSGTSSHDFYEMREGDRLTSIADLSSAAGSYLRGLEFSAQAQYFLANSTFAKDAILAGEVDRILAAVQC